ncbi:hypothetical protein NEF87_001422 [Candidatus Lokiarchaeum ossiferum]|uniref:ABC3 transporter permease C-terminal domain-containing protein n=1 Tax=Candidatus Lokiarchaeum ossiferum TaxID=2951803 RepID=A0ABY6HNR1_9ARCH|nr:hypothetical protein NEF87_001422 [Candidatus Lokiarchaeum sp. B-35]
MGNKISFYWKQGIKYTKQSKLTILALGLAVSMVAGFGYYFDSAQEFTLQQGYTNMFDFCVDIDNDAMDWTIGENETYIQDIFSDSSLDILDSYYYREISSELLYINQDIFGVIEQQDLVWISANNLYSSSRFQNYINIDEGKVPTNPGECLVASEFADEYNLSVSSKENLTIQVNTIGKYNLTLDDINIVGLYSTKRVLAQVGESDFDFNQFRIFTYNDFSNESQIYPTESIINAFENDSYIQNRKNFGFTIKTLLGVDYDRDSVNIAWLSASSEIIEDEFQRTIYNFPSTYQAYNIISPVFLEQFDFQTDIRLSIQFTNLPLYLFAIYLGSIANKSNIRKRYFEFFSMRMRGFPKRMVQNQLITESIVNSFFISILGILFGFGIFFLGQYWLNPIFLNDFNVEGFLLSPSVTITTIGETFLFGTVMTLLASISAIRFINKLKTSEISSALTQKEGDTDYDETSLYIKEYKSQINEAAKQEELDIQNFIKRKEELIPKWGVAISFAALLPPILFFMVLLGQRPGASDSLIEIALVLQSQITFITILTIASPFVLVAGLLRFLIVESPPRFAKIAKKISHLFIRKRDYLVGIEMTRQKQYTRIVFLIGIFVSLLVFGNMSTNSLVRQSQIRTNLAVGADLKMEFLVAGQIFEDHEDLDNFSDEIRNLRDDTNNSVVNDMTLVYTKFEHRGQVKNNQFFVNLTEYLDIVKESDKNLPNQNFASDIQSVIDYNADLSEDNAGIIVSSTYLANNDFRIGETVVLTHTSTNYVTGARVNKLITARIFMVLDVMPGLYFSQDDLEDFMIIDTHVFNYSKEVIPTNRVIELIDVNNLDTEGTNDYTPIINLIRDSSTYNTYAVEFESYNYNWKTVDSSSYNTIEIPYLGLFYFNLIVIGAVLAVGVAILIFSAQDQNKSMYGELLARGFGRKGIYSMLSVQMLIAFLISVVVGILGGTLTSMAFCKMYSLTLGGGFLNMPIFFNYLEFVLVLGMVLGLTFAFMIVGFFNQSKLEICEFLEDTD